MVNNNENNKYLLRGKLKELTSTFIFKNKFEIPVNYLFLPDYDLKITVLYIILILFNIFFEKRKS